MNKCPNCGTEFEGKFCPECGKVLQAAKTCPSCGATLNGEVKFCNECGYSFAQQIRPAQQNKPLEPTLSAAAPQRTMPPYCTALYNVACYAPTILFALFALLTFVFFAAPLKRASLFGLSESVNLYQSFNDSELHGCVIALIVFAVIAVPIAALSVYKIKSVAPQKNSFSVSRRIVYLCEFIASCTAIRLINKADGGFGVYSAGACPILLLVFSLVFLLLDIGAYFAAKSLLKAYPAIIEEKRKKAQEKNENESERRKQFYASHTPPVKPQNNVGKEAYYYRHAKRRYDRAKEGAPSAALVWLDWRKKIIVPITVILLIVIILLSILIPYSLNIFRIGKVKKIDIGDSQSAVEKVLGAPDEETDSVWAYYGDNYLKLAEKLSTNYEKQEAALLSGDIENLSKLLSKAEKLEAQLLSVTYKYIEIGFDKNEYESYGVSYVVLDTTRCDGATDVQKAISSYSVVNAQIEYFETSCEFYYVAEFTDGSYRLAKTTAYIASGETTDDLTKDSVSVCWQDGFYRDYTADITLHKSPYYLRGNELIIALNSADLSKLSSEEKASIQSVTFADGVTSIGRSMFSGCTGLTSIVIPDRVTSIGKEAFRECTGLTSVTIGSGVTKIGDHAFYNCTSLTSIYYTGNVASWCGITGLDSLMSSSRTLYINNQELTGDLVIPDSVTKIGSYAFYGCTGLTSITIPNSVTVIGSGAFYGCTGLTSVVIPDSVTSIGSYAFRGCTGLTSIVIPDRVTSIGDYAFYGCTGLTSVVIPDRVTSIGDYAFSGCKGLTSVVIPDSVTKIGSYAFSGCTKLTSVTIGSGVTVIGDYAFYGCTGLTSIVIPDSVTSIGDYAFYGCTGLTSIVIPDRVTSIGSYAFYNTAYYNDESNWVNGILYLGKYLLEAKTSLTGAYTIKTGTLVIVSSAFSGCTKLTSIVIPDGVTSIGSYVFKGCTGLTSVTIGSGVTSIGSGAFYNCTALTEINYNATECADLSGDNDVFSYAGQNGVGITVTIGANIKSIPAYLFYPQGGRSSYSPKIVSVVFAEDSVCESIGDYAFKGCTGLTSVTIGSGVTVIGSYAFEDCTGLTSVTIGSGVTVIGDHAFYGCKGLTSVVIPDSVTKIGSYAFRGCTKLTSVTIGSGVTVIGDYAFYYTDLTSVVIPDSVTKIGDYTFRGCTKLTSVVIPDRVTSIGDYAFYGCTGLTSVVIPDRVTSIGSYAFRGCTGLTSITIPDSVTVIGGGAFEGCTGLTSVTFENTDGWCVYYSYEKSISSTDLANSATAATYLTWTYKDCYCWSRS